MDIVSGEDHGFVAGLDARVSARDDHAIAVDDGSDGRIPGQADGDQGFLGDLAAVAGDVLDGFHVEAGQAGDGGDALVPHVALDGVDGQELLAQYRI